ncbi:MAG: diacylglycerol kinase family protein [Bacteroidota bacterium]
MQTLFLINPASGRKQDAEETAQLISEIYGKAGKPVTYEMIDFSRLDQRLEEAIAAGIHRIYAVGGDGTVNAIGTRLMHKPVCFGVIPKGSGNGYARNLGFSIRTKLAISQTLNAAPIQVDTATFNGQPFLNVAGVGLDAVVAWIFSEGKNRGFGPYIRSTAEGMLGYEPEDYEVEINGERVKKEKLMGIAIANGTQWGYNAKISPHASLTDGLLDIIMVRKFPILRVGSIVGKLFNGKMQKSRYVEVHRAREIKIWRKDSGPAQIDGEPIEAGREIHIQIQEKSLQVLLPNTLTEKKIQSL